VPNKQVEGGGPIGARANAIVVGVLVLAPAIVGAEAYAIYRTFRRLPQGSAESVRSSESPASGEADAPDLIAFPADPPEAPEAPPPPRPAAPTQAAAGGDGTAGEVEPAVTRRQRALYQRRAQVIREADERVFDTLGVPDEQRAAIRSIDLEYARTLATIAASGNEVELRNEAIDANAEQTRRQAIGDVLGPDTTRAFNFAERKAERIVRNRHRPEVVRGY
jgi:hypothetical protein